MRFIMDTHTFIWWSSNPSKLSSKVFNLIQDQSNDIYVSVASIWEMQIKLQLGKLMLKIPLLDIIEKERSINNVSILPIVLSHVLELSALPNFHKDPFDRILIVQAAVEKAILLSKDTTLKKYPIKIIW